MFEKDVGGGGVDDDDALRGNSKLNRD